MKNSDSLNTYHCVVRSVSENIETDLGFVLRGQFFSGTVLSLMQTNGCHLILIVLKIIRFVAAKYSSFNHVLRLLAE